MWHRQKWARRSLAVPPAAQVHSLQGEYSECLLRVRSLLRRSQVQVAGSRLPCVLRTSVPDICKTGPGARRRCASGSPFLLSSCQHPNCSGCGGRMPTLLGPEAEMRSKGPKQVVRPAIAEGSVPLASKLKLPGIRYGMRLSSIVRSIGMRKLTHRSYSWCCMTGIAPSPHAPQQRFSCYSTRLLGTMRLFRIHECGIADCPTVD